MFGVLATVIVRDRQTRLARKGAEPISQRPARMPGALLWQLRQAKTPTLPFKNDVERHLASPRHDGVRFPVAELGAVVSRCGALIDSDPVGYMGTLVFPAVAFAASLAMPARQTADETRSVSIDPLVDRLMADRNRSTAAKPACDQLRRPAVFKLFTHIKPQAGVL